MRLVADHQTSLSNAQPNSPLLNLPTELLQTIFSNLDITDVLAARKACSTLASVGIDYFGDEMPLVYDRDKFKALTQIAQHPRLSKRMRSLFYVVDRFKNPTYEEWNQERTDLTPMNRSEYLAGTTDSEDDMGNLRRATQTAYEARAARLAAVSEVDLRDGYIAFLTACYDQLKIEDDRYDYTCLRSFFQGCCNIREVTIASRVHCDRTLNA